MNLKEICRQYMAAFSRKDLHALESMFDERVTLRDWDISAQGRAAVLEANAKIFAAVESIVVEPLNLIQDEQTVACEMSITLNGTDRLLVTDIIEFSETGKIRAVRAYKG